MTTPSHRNNFGTHGTPSTSTQYSPAESWICSDPGTALTPFFDSDMNLWTVSPADSTYDPSFAPDESGFSGLGCAFDADDDALVTGMPAFEGPLFGCMPLADDHVPANNESLAHGLGPSELGPQMTHDMPNQAKVQEATTVSPGLIYHSAVPEIIVGAHEPSIAPEDAQFFAHAQVHLEQELVADRIPSLPAYSDDALLDSRRDAIGSPAGASTGQRRLPRKERGYRCEHPECPKVFDTRSDLNHHTQYHRPANLLCGIDGCASSFAVKSQLTRHQDTVHVAEFKYHCHLCDKHTNRRDVHKRHLSTSAHTRRAKKAKVEIHQ